MNVDIPAEVIRAMHTFLVDKKTGNIVVHFRNGRIRKLHMEEAVKID